MYMSESVGIAELRQNLSRYLKLVSEGESLVVTDHNRPVAMLGPIPKRSATMQRLIDEGKLNPPVGNKGLPEPLDIDLPPGALQEALEWTRGEPDRVNGGEL
jgi:prevent-host-death family protein